MTRTELPARLGLMRICKSFGSVVALRDVSLSLQRGEIVAVLGGNGAGKSTLLHILCGLLHADSGIYTWEGETVTRWTVREARAHGVEIVYQDLALADNLSVVDNIFLGREQRRRGWLGGIGVLNRTAMRADAGRAIGDIAKIITDLDAGVRMLSGGQRQVVALARALHQRPMLLLLDEPTAFLAGAAADALYRHLITYRNEAMTIVVVTHRIDEALRVADRVVVLRAGEVVLEALAEDTSPQTLMTAILGTDAHDVA